MDENQPKKQLTKDQSVLALSLLTDLINERRAAVTFTVTRSGELVEISSGKVLMEQKPKKRLNDYIR